ncbi:MAG: PAS domain S-box protein [Chloroflexi bacterium]|nr:PAS domain S-box protein [Chloroflexota bacterium]
MSLSAKALAIITTVGVLSALIATFSLASGILLSDFGQLEDRVARENVQRALNELEDTGERMNQAARDWAGWDDTYQFIQDGNAAYIQSNLAPSASFVNNQINLMVFVDSSARIVYAKAYDARANREISFPESLRPPLKAGALLVSHANANSSVVGWLDLPEGPLLIVSQPIVNSERTAPMRGALIWARWIDAAAMENFARHVHLSLSLTRLLDARLPAELPSARQDSLHPALIGIQPVNDQALAGFALIPDIDGAPAFVLRAEMPRPIYAQAQGSVRDLLWMLAFIAVIFSAPMQFLVYRAARAAEIQRESDKRFRALTESANDAIIIANEQARVVSWNASAQKTFGYAADEIIGAPITRFIPERYQARYHQGLGAGRSAHDGKIIQAFGRRKDGAEFPAEISLSAWELNHQKFYSAIIRDITERKRAEQQSATILHTSLDGFWISDAQGKILEVNESYCRLSGYTRAELLQMRVSDVEAVETTADTQQHIQRIIQTGSDRFETKHRRKDGAVIDIEVSVNYLDIEGGRFFVFFRDITERKQAEEALRKKDEHHRNVVESIFRFVPEGLLVFTENLGLVKQNKAFEEITQQYAARLGYTEQELAGLIAEQARSRLLSGDTTEIYIPKKRR